EGEPGLAVLNELRCGDDVVELFNPGARAASLAALALSTGTTDSPQALTGTLASGAFLDVALEAGLPCAGSVVQLQDAMDGAVLDELTSPAVARDQTWGRLPDGSGAPSLNTPTPAAANRPWLDPSDAVFTTATAPLVVRLTVAVDDQATLEAAPYEWVPASFAATVDEGGTPASDAPLSVAIRIKGKLGSFRGCPFSCGDKSSFKIDFNQVVAGQQWRRIEKLNLNNQVQDPARTHEWLAYEVFREAGVPAPRTGYAQLFVNDEDFGLYALVEDRDDPFLDNHYPQGTRALFEGEYGQDLFPGGAGDFDLDEGEETDRLALGELIDAIEVAPVTGFHAALAGRLDWSEVLPMMATEIFIGHWDGYAPTRNNYFLHVDDLDRWTLLPWGTDQTFADAWPLFDGNGLLMQRCRADEVCLAAYTAALRNVAAATAARDFASELRALAARLQPLADADPRAEPTDLSAWADSALAFLADRVAQVQAELGCMDNSAADLDGDGRACSFDCDEANPARYVGGDDSCPGGASDGVDNDCNGRVDDGADCPDCSERVIGASTYSFGRAPRAWAAAAAHCAAQGGTLAVVDSEAEWPAVHAASVELLGGVDAWIGLDDTADEGTYLWADGSELSFDAWAPGEPNDWGDAEDCAEARPDGQWNDLFCDAELPSLCER
ncbi:MAG: CotH kinase family protein, partial [Deltaproteobacteria bacterium]|nr:CotH kinase family protein [Deltaproteobacteria bacterium]